MTPETAVVVTVFVGWISAVWLHELAHTLAAYWCGDKQALELVWKPHRYVHPITSLALPLVALFFGGIPLMGGAAQVNPDASGTRLGTIFVYLAGPLVSGLIAVALVVPFHLGHAPTSGSDPFWMGIATLGFFQVYVTMLCLVPVPPLDASGAVGAVLPTRLRASYKRIGFTGLAIVFFVLYRFPQFSEVVLDLTMKLGFPRDLVLGGLNVVVSYFREMTW